MKYQENADDLNLTHSETQSKPRQDRQRTHEPHTEARSWDFFFFAVEKQ